MFNLIHDNKSSVGRNTMIFEKNAVAGQQAFVKKTYRQTKNTLCKIEMTILLTITSQG